MNSYSITFDPLIGETLLILLGVALLALSALAFLRRVRGRWFRLGAGAALLLAAANPVLLREEREPLPSTVAIVVDRSQSQRFDGRDAQTDAALSGILERLQRMPQFEPRVVDSANSAASGETRLFEALGEALRDVPPSRLAGAVLITDGQVHDAPANAAELGFDAPLHTLLTGRADERDRRLSFTVAPRFGLVGQPLDFSWAFEDAGGDGAAANVTIRINGEPVAEVQAMPGAVTTSAITPPVAGRNIIEIEVETADGEITPANNRAIAIVDGIRENLRVLLVSGEPHAGERAWRNLLKSDADVDLVHFTILRPPEKQDGTPINELSLIAFPTRELFVEKINDFDLIILDRYQDRNVLPLLYYDYIARYVEEGGALLVAAGPEYAGELSLASTPLYAALPAMPTGDVIERGFRPELTDLGRRHPVTRGLDGADQTPPAWSRWFRQIPVGEVTGVPVMSGVDGAPLLVLNRFGEGRVALLLSDHGWLWSRGFEGGGPHVQLYRRTAHWLMGQPELEEERLTAEGEGEALVITRQTMAEDAAPATVLTPSGEQITVPLVETAEGRFSGRLETTETGLFQIGNEDLSTLAHVGATDSPEFQAVTSTPEIVQPLAEATGGAVIRLASSSGVRVPNIVPVRGRTAAGDDWIGLRPTQDSLLTAVNRQPLFAGFLGLGVLLVALGAAWWREGR
ncbi:MAG: hypothetical protein MUC58_01935 [Rhizobiaceae bacterium]|nr:hypothetical protein [Rhizobiaceae bacterium]